MLPGASSLSTGLKFRQPRARCFTDLPRSLEELLVAHGRGCPSPQFFAQRLHGGIDPHLHIRIAHNGAEFVVPFCKHPSEQVRVPVLANWDICSLNRGLRQYNGPHRPSCIYDKVHISGNSRTNKLMLNSQTCTYISTRQRDNLFSSSVEGNAKRPSHPDMTMLFHRKGFISPL